LTDIEIATVTFNTGGAFVASSASSLTTVYVDAGTASTAIVTGLASGSTVYQVDGDTDVITLDTVSDATLTVYAQGVASGALTITDASTVNLYVATADASYDSVVLDTSDTTTLVVADTVAFAFDTGDITGTDALTTITATTSTSEDADLTIGTVVDIGAVTAITLTAAYGDIIIGNLGTDSNGAEGELLTTMTLSATSGATLSVADGSSVFVDSVTDSTTDTTFTISATTDSTSDIDLGIIDNTFGSIVDVSIAAGTILVDKYLAAAITITASGAGSYTVTAVDSYTGITGGDVTATFSGAGDFELTEVDADGDVTITGSDITASGTLTVVLDDVTGDATITGGVGISMITTSDATGSGATYITLGDTNGLADVIYTNTTDVGVIEITNFEVDYDVLELDMSALVTATGLTLNLLGDAATAASSTITFTTLTTAGDISAATTDILVLDSDFALSSMVVTAIEDGGTFELTLDAGTWLAAGNDGIIVLWDDGTDSYLSFYEGDSSGASTAFDSGEGTLQTLVTFVGISDATTITAAALGGSFN
jgi:hypothetical protein